jgi:hypothetical protein
MLPWALAGRDAMKVCDEALTAANVRFFGLGTSLYPASIYIPYNLQFASSVICWAVFGVSGTRTAMRTRVQAYYAAAAILNGYRATANPLANCGGFFGPTARVWLSNVLVLCGWYFQVGTTLLLHFVVIAKIDLQQAQTTWLKRVVRFEALMVLVVSGDLMLCLYGVVPVLWETLWPRVSLKKFPCV